MGFNKRLIDQGGGGSEPIEGWLYAPGDAVAIAGDVEGYLRDNSWYKDGTNSYGHIMKKSTTVTTYNYFSVPKRLEGGCTRWYAEITIGPNNWSGLYIGFNGSPSYQPPVTSYSYWYSDGGGSNFGEGDTVGVWWRPCSQTYRWQVNGVTVQDRTGSDNEGKYLAIGFANNTSGNTGELYVNLNNGPDA